MRTAAGRVWARALRNNRRARRYQSSRSGGATGLSSWIVWKDRCARLLDGIFRIAVDLVVGEPQDHEGWR